MSVGAPNGEAPRATAMRSGAQVDVGPLRIDANAQGVHVETGAEEPEPTKWEKKREDARAKKEAKVVKQEDIDAEEEAAKKEEKLTNKYDDGVEQVVDYFREFFGNPEQNYAIEDIASIQDTLAAAGILLLPRDAQSPGGAETPEQYARRAAQVVFHEARVAKFGDAALAPSGDVKGETQRVRDRLRWRGFRLKRQIASTRTTLKEWRQGMGDRLDTYNAAGVRAEYLVNQGRATVDVDAAAIAAGIGAAGEGMQDLIERTRRGELVNPLEMMLGRLVKLPEDRIPNTDVREAPENRQRAIGERARDALASAIGRIGLPAEMIPAITGADTTISQLVEGVIGVASQTPEAVFKAHEALLDLQALSQALLKISGGKLNLMLQLNRTVAELTGGTVSVTDMLEYTVPMADDFVVRHPEQGVVKLLNDARRESIRMGGDTVKDRAANRAMYMAARRIPYAGRVVRGYETPKGAVDEYAAKAEEPKEEPKEEYRPKWGWLNQTERAKQWRAEQRKLRDEEAARKRHAGEMPKQFETGLRAQAEQAEREARLADLTPEELARELESSVAAPQAEQAAPEPVGPTPEEIEEQTQAREDAQIATAEANLRDLTARAIFERRNPRRTEESVRAVAEQLRRAGTDLDALRNRVNTDRGERTYQRQLAVVLDANAEGDARSAAYQALLRDYPQRAAELNAAMGVNAPTAPEPQPQAPAPVDLAAPVLSDALAAFNRGMTEEDVTSLRERASQLPEGPARDQLNAQLEDLIQRQGTVAPAANPGDGI